MRFFALLSLFAICISHEPHFREIFQALTGASEQDIANALFESPFASVVESLWTEDRILQRREMQTVDGGLPLVFAHGMGDSCFNKGMKDITKESGSHLGVYSVCIPTGDNRISDTNNGFFMTMDKNVDVFAEKIRKDANLKNGFHAVGFSQGNSVIRGYIQKYQDPPVHTWLSVHGTVNGVAGFPNCSPTGLLGPVCKLIAELLGDLAYEEWVQNLLFQADYFRDPTRMNDQKYLNNSQIAQWNNENPSNVNQTFKTNFIQTKRFAMIKALNDSMVYPNEAEWWGQFAPGSFKTIQKMKDTDNYKLDRFGLQTVDKAGKIMYNTTNGNHLQFTEADLYFWLDNYLVV